MPNAATAPRQIFVDSSCMHVFRMGKPKDTALSRGNLEDFQRLEAAHYPRNLRGKKGFTNNNQLHNSLLNSVKYIYIYFFFLINGSLGASLTHSQHSSVGAVGHHLWGWGYRVQTPVAGASVVVIYGQLKHTQSERPFTLPK